MLCVLTFNAVIANCRSIEPHTIAFFILAALISFVGIYRCAASIDIERNGWCVPPLMSVYCLSLFKPNMSGGHPATPAASKAPGPASLNPPASDVASHQTAVGSRSSASPRLPTTQPPPSTSTSTPPTPAIMQPRANPMSMSSLLSGDSGPASGSTSAAASQAQREPHHHHHHHHHRHGSAGMPSYGYYDHFPRDREMGFGMPSRATGPQQRSEATSQPVERNEPARSPTADSTGDHSTTSNNVASHSSYNMSPPPRRPSMMDSNHQDQANDTKRRRSDGERSAYAFPVANSASTQQPQPPSSSYGPYSQQMQSQRQHHAPPPPADAPRYPSAWGVEDSARRRQASFEYPSRGVNAHSPPNAHNPSPAHRPPVASGQYWSAPASSGASAAPPPSQAPKSSSRPDYFTTDPLRGSEIESGQRHHHHYHAPVPPSGANRKDGTVTSASQQQQQPQHQSLHPPPQQQSQPSNSAPGQNQWNKAFPFFTPSSAYAPMGVKWGGADDPSSQAGHKRKRSDAPPPDGVQSGPPPPSQQPQQQPQHQHQHQHQQQGPPPPGAYTYPGPSDPHHYSAAGGPPTGSGAAPGASLQPVVALPPAPKVPKRPEGPLFTALDAMRVKQAPQLLRVRSANVQSAIKASTTESEPTFLGRFVWNPKLDAARMLDAELLRSHIGGRLHVVIDVAWLQGGGRWQVCDPSTSLQEPAADAKSVPSAAKSAAWTFWDLRPLRRRCLWGTEVYTDDSDVLAMCLHTGWLRIGDAAAASTAIAKATALEVTVIVAPRLVRYQGSTRGGVRSRSWGNGHDGVSLMIDNVKVVDVGLGV